MPFTRLRTLAPGPRRREQIAAGLILTDRGLRFIARWGVPGAVGFLILSGPLLPMIGGGLTPYAGLRSLHVLAGLGLTLAVIYRALAAIYERGMERVRRSSVRGSEMPQAIAWRVSGRTALQWVHGILLITVLWTGFERYIGQRWGVAVLPLLSATEWSLAHRLIAPYYVAALLLLWFIKTRVAWRQLIEQWRRP